MRNTGFTTILGRVRVGIVASALSLAVLSALPVAAKEDAVAVAPASGKYLTFTDHRGRAVSERDFLGRFLLVFFGYTYCPDVCPTDLQVMSEAMDALGDVGKKVHPVFITIDPKRDTAQVLAQYVANFHPRLIGLTGTEAEIAAAAKAYDVHAEISGGERGSSEYFINHTAQTYLIGPDGKGVDLFEHGTPAEKMAGTILKYLRSPPN